MRARANSDPKALEVCALYSVETLARVAGVTHQLLRRLLASNGVTLVSVGRTGMVPLSEIEVRIPPLWRSIVAAERLRVDARSERHGRDSRRSDR
jgi:hypothetical protein